MATKKNNYISADLDPRSFVHDYGNNRISRFVLTFPVKGDKYYLYAHIRDDNGDPFYFGIGTRDRDKWYYRATSDNNRNQIWKRIVAKTTYTVMIIEDSPIKKKMCDQEIQYIRIMGKKKDKKGPLANITDGGEGLLGHKGFEWTEEMRKAASERIKNRVIKDSTREKHRQNLYARGYTGRKGKDHPASKPIIQICPETGNIIKEFVNSIEAAMVFNIHSASITSAIRKGYTSVGFKWKYKDLELQQKVEKVLNSKVPKERKREVQNNFKAVFQVDPLTDEIIKEFDSLRMASRAFGVHHQMITKACDNNQEYLNYKWRKKNG